MGIAAETLYSPPRHTAEWDESPGLQLQGPRDLTLGFIEQTIEIVEVILARYGIPCVPAAMPKPEGGGRKEADKAGVPLLTLVECDGLSSGAATEDELGRASKLPIEGVGAGIGSVPWASTVAYDYRHQAWLENGCYVACGHLAPCNCHGRLHEGEAAAPDADIH